MQLSLTRLTKLVAIALAWTSTSLAQSPISNSSAETSGNRPVDIGFGCGASSPYPSTANGATGPATLRFTYMMENPIAEFISLHFSEFNLPATDYVIIKPTYDPVSAKLPVLTYDGMTRNGSFFSQALFTQAITLELYTTGTTVPMNVTECLGFQIDSYRYLASATGSTKEEVCGADDSVDAACARDSPANIAAVDTANAVLRLLIHKGSQSFFCTGWLFGCEGHMITNHHCISTQGHASNTEYEFMGQGSSCAVPCNVPLGCRGPVRATRAKLIVANEELDYAMVQFDTTFHQEYGFLKMRAAGATLGEQIFLPQHPAGFGKRLAIKAEGEPGSVLSLSTGGCLPDQVAYNLDTQGGSSGSPVISWGSNEVVALHHCGGCPNTAVNTNKIVADLQAKGLLPQCAVA